MKKKKRLLLLGDILGVLVTCVIFLVPFYFMLDRKSTRLNSSHA